MNNFFLNIKQCIKDGLNDNNFDLSTFFSLSCIYFAVLLLAMFCDALVFLLEFSEIDESSSFGNIGGCLAPVDILAANDKVLKFKSPEFILFTEAFSTN